VQRVASGSVSWEDGAEQHRATIGQGFVLLVGAGSDDDEATVRRLADKVVDCVCSRTTRGTKAAAYF